MQVKNIFIATILGLTLSSVMTPASFANTDTSTSSSQQQVQTPKAPELFLDGYTLERTNVLEVDGVKVYSGLFTNGLIQQVLIRVSPETVPMTVYNVNSLSVQAPTDMSAEVINQVLESYALSQRVTK
ncbi:hypothetical protein [Psittacicella gerlachiana]|uniref:Uncharacterized protein n=1 Tax=Psittacicella gerlachiana TaxID=2028574 RepID=A0A3A1Y8D9_9GAMM|nr:hypothetical protein [Psittacicella gerlachiana]RIY32384.1 hypothetical protein CKF59_06995 [Psittacicella gerlachiana]